MLKKRVFKPNTLLALGLLGCMSGSIYAVTPAQIKQAIEQQQPAYLKTLESLVNIESGSRDLEGLNKIAQLVADRLQQTGAQVSVIQANDLYRMDDSPEQVGPMVKAVLKGQGKGKIMLIAHMDTVYQKGQLKEQPFKIEGNKIYGLGILDDKQGVANIIDVIDTLQ